MELYDVMRTTFSARDYTGEEVPDDLIHDLIENARFAPSGGNRQGNRVQITAGLSAGERVVTRGAFLIRLASKSTEGAAHGHAH